MEQSAFPNDQFIFTSIIVLHSEDVHGAHTMNTGDVVMFIRIDADAIQVPRNMGCGAASNITGHVTLEAFGGVWTLRGTKMEGGL